MAVLESNQTVSNNVSGFDKGIHASARTMMLDNLQGTMYQKPVESAVRECVSNAVDAVKEKLTAIKIKSGEAKVEDFYLSREDVKDKIASADDDIYEDSEFNPDYYDLRWLDPINNTVKLEYVNTEQTKRDQFIINDPGVGLGGKRLEGFFSLGYSSKRLNSGELGGFGLGAKSPLSTGVESYRMISRYNGKEFCFDIYSHKVDCVYGKWGDAGKMNNFVEFSTVMVDEKYKDEAGEQQVRKVPYKAYYKDTTEKNGTTLIIDVKKHNKAKYLEAVKSQLMYIKTDITFHEVSVSGVRSNIPFKANIIYEDDNIIMSDSGYYSQPHFVINGVAYGLVDFNEADLAVKRGNIGVKFKMEKLDVVPSREGVRYTSKTTGALVSTYDEVAKTVEAKVQLELQQPHILDWVRACNKVMYTVGNNSKDVVGRLSSFIDSTNLRPEFGSTGIKYSSDAKGFITPLLRMEHIYLEKAATNYGWGRQATQTKRKLGRADATNTLLFDKPLYFQTGPYSNKVNTYLAFTHDNVSGFCTLKVNASFMYLENVVIKLIRQTITEEEFIKEATAEVIKMEVNDEKIKSIVNHLNKVALLISHMSTECITGEMKVYEDIVVPEGFKAVEESANGTETVVDIEDNIDHAAIAEAARIAKYKLALQRRRENKAFVGYKLANKKVNSYYYKAGFDRQEMSVNDLDFDNTTVVYGDDSDEEAFNLMIDLAKHRGGNYDNVSKIYYWSDEVKAIKVAKTNLRYVKNEGTHVKDYLINIEEDGTLKGTKEMRELLTSKSILKYITGNSKFLRNFSQINPEIADSYQKLSNYVAEAPNTNVFIGDHANNPYLQMFNQFADVNLAFMRYEHLTEDERTELLDGVDTSKFDIDVLNVDIIDREIYEEALKIDAFVQVYGSIFSHIDILTDSTKKGMLPIELVSDLKEIVEQRKDQLEYTYEGINK